MVKYKTFNDYCPEQRDYETIEIEYMHVPVMNAEDGYKKGRFDCDYLENHDCSFENRRECPLYNDAPVTL